MTFEPDHDLSRERRADERGKNNKNEDFIQRQDVVVPSGAASWGRGHIQTKEKNMKKILMTAAILAAFLAFLALPSSQASAAKPIRWKATIVPIDGANLIGPTTDFVGGVDNVNINYGLDTDSESCGPTGNSLSYLLLQVFNPSSQSLQIINMSGFSGYATLPPSYGFPNTTTNIWPDCVADFLSSGPHPTADYPVVSLRFSTCGCGNTTTDFMKMGVGATIPVHFELLFFSHIWSCPAPSAQKTFLNLQMNAHGYVKTVGSLPDIYITRISQTEWTAYVDTKFDNGAFQKTETDLDSASADWPVRDSDNILGQYATCDWIKAPKGNKRIWTTTYHYPCAKAPFKFQIVFTKN